MLPRRDISSAFSHMRKRERTQPTDAIGLQALLDDLAARFQRITGFDATVTRPWLNRFGRNRTLRRWAEQPPCRPHRKTVACRRSRLLHLRVLDSSVPPRQSLPHTCPFGNICCLFYLYEHGEMLGICKIAFLESISRSRVQSSLEILDILFENLRLKADDRSKSAVSSKQLTVANLTCDELHPQVRRSIDMIRRDFRDPDLNVECVADRVGSSSAYLSHLFVTQVGCRMRRYILNCRISEAQRLLRGNHALVKDVAIACGFLNTDWFSHLFHEETGLTPTQFRRQHRRVSKQNPKRF